MGTGDQLGCLGGPGGDVEEPGHHIGGARRDDAESGLGPDKSLGDVVDDAVATHRHDDRCTLVHGSLGGCRRLDCRSRPKGIHIVVFRQLGHHIAM